MNGWIWLWWRTQKYWVMINHLSGLTSIHLHHLFSSLPTSLSPYHQIFIYQNQPDVKLHDRECPFYVICVKPVFTNSPTYFISFSQFSKLKYMYRLSSSTIFCTDVFSQISDTLFLPQISMVSLTISILLLILF